LDSGILQRSASFGNFFLDAAAFGVGIPRAAPLPLLGSGPGIRGLLLKVGAAIEAWAKSSKT